MIDSDRKARMLLCCATDGGDPVIADLVQKLGAEGAWAKITEGALGEPAAERAARVSIDEVQRLAVAAAMRFVVPGAEEWPDGIDDLRHAEPIQRRGGEPLGLWVRGPGHLAHLMERSVAIVGSRAATAYGNGIATDLAADLVEQGVTVVSGGAFGIDVAAHRGALGAGGPTVCVLANGVDVAYPPAHAALFETLAKHQLLVSELPPGAQAAQDLRALRYAPAANNDCAGATRYRSGRRRRRVSRNRIRERIAGALQRYSCACRGARRR